jgi:hypothetical protein
MDPVISEEFRKAFVKVMDVLYVVFYYIFASQQLTMCNNGYCLMKNKQTSQEMKTGSH